MFSAVTSFASVQLNWNMAPNGRWVEYSKELKIRVEEPNFAPLCWAMRWCRGIRYRGGCIMHTNVRRKWNCSTPPPFPNAAAEILFDLIKMLLLYNRNHTERERERRILRWGLRVSFPSCALYKPFQIDRRLRYKRCWFHHHRMLSIIRPFRFVPVGHNRERKLVQMCTIAP